MRLVDLFRPLNDAFFEHLSESHSSSCLATPLYPVYTESQFVALGTGQSTISIASEVAQEFEQDVSEVPKFDFVPLASPCDLLGLILTSCQIGKLLFDIGSCLTSIFNILSTTNTLSPQDYATQYIILCSLKHGNRSPLITNVYEALSTYTRASHQEREARAISSTSSYLGVEAHSDLSCLENVDHTSSISIGDFDSQGLRSVEGWWDWDVAGDALEASISETWES